MMTYKSNTRASAHATGDWYVASLCAATDHEEEAVGSVGYCLLGSVPSETDHEEEIVGFVCCCLLGGVLSEPVCRVNVRSILQVLFDDP